MNESKAPPPSESDPGQAFSVGTDLVWLKDNGAMTVYAAREMDGWRAGRYRQTLVVFRDRSYRVDQARPLGNGRYRYVLSPWNPASGELPGLVVRYEEPYVGARDQAANRERRTGNEGFFLLALYPVLGFLPGKVKVKLENRYGFDPLRLTAWSLSIQVLFFLLLAVIILTPAYIVVRAKLGIPEGWWGLELALDLTALFLFVDLLVRFGRTWDTASPQYGLGEWLAAWLNRSGPRPGRRSAARPTRSPEREEPPSAPEMEAPAPQPTAPAALRQIGGDLVEVNADGLKVVTRGPIPGWRAGRYRKVKVHFEDCPYQVVGVTEGAKGMVVYQLTPWPESDTDLPGAEFHYGPEYALERQAARKAASRVAWAAWAFWATGMLWGFAWSMVKLRLEDHYNLDPRDLTRYSLFLESGLGLVFLIWVVVDLTLPNAAPFRVWGVDLGVAGSLATWPDVVVRSLRFHEGGPVQWGFYEWLLHRRRPSP